MQKQVTRMGIRARNDQAKLLDTNEIPNPAAMLQMSNARRSIANAYGSSVGPQTENDSVSALDEGLPDKFEYRKCGIKDTREQWSSQRKKLYDAM